MFQAVACGTHCRTWLKHPKLQLSCISHTFAWTHLCGRLHERGWREHWPHIVFVFACGQTSSILVSMTFFSVIALTAGLNLCLEIIGLSKTISCFMNTDKYTPQLSWGSTSSLSLTLYIVSSYSWNTEVNSTFIRQTLLLHLFHAYQVTFIKTGTLPEADLQCTVCLLVLIKTRIGFEKC